MLNLCMHLDGVQIPWTLLPSSGMSCYSITAQDSSQRPCYFIVADYYSLNVLEEWSGSFSIVGTSMTTKMALIHAYQEEGQAESVELFASSTVCIICLSRCRASLQQHKGSVTPQTCSSSSPQLELGNTFSFSFIILSQIERVGMGSIML